MKIFITATNTNIGKTYITTDLIKKLTLQGVKTCGYKPIETGVKTAPEDALKLLGVSQLSHPTLENLTLDLINTYQFPLPAAPAVADVNHDIDIETICNQASRLEKMCDVVLIEGAGGVMTPLTNDTTIIDLIEKFDIPVILVAGDHLGSISETLLALEALERRNISTLLVFNPYRDQTDFATITLPYWKSKYKRVMIYEQSFDEIVDLIKKGGVWK